MSSGSPTTRTRILEACVQVLETMGGAGTRMGDIAKAAGISRQAVYLHFNSRADLLDATTRYIDDQLDLERRLAPSRNAASGRERLDAYIAFWASYVPQIHHVAKALIAVKETDADARAAWEGRMSALRDGCRAAIQALDEDGHLADHWTVKKATDLLWSLLSVETWQHLTRDCGWSRTQYARQMQFLARRCFLRDG